ncbi:MAG: zinc ribbon domain-containing protein [Planctomycetota bacterium]|jgi:hypothetical protein
MPNDMQFTDCPNCGKRIRTDAPRCHRCGEVPVLAFNRARDVDGPSEVEEERSESQHAVRWGGYRVDEDDFDYDTYLEDEFGEPTGKQPKPWWWYVAWVVLVVFALGILADAWLLFLST